MKKFEILDDKWDRKIVWTAFIAPLALSILYFLLLSWALREASASKVNQPPGWVSAFEKRALFGDSFGALNALFAGYAFAFLLVAVREQKKEIRLQRSEIQLQQESLAAFKSEVEGQNSHAQLERFETKFFKLLDDLRNLQIPAEAIETKRLGQDGRGEARLDLGMRSLFQEIGHPNSTVEACLGSNNVDGAISYHIQWSGKARLNSKIESYCSWLLLTIGFLADSSQEPQFARGSATHTRGLGFYLGLLSASLPTSIQFWVAIELLSDASHKPTIALLNKAKCVVFTKLDERWKTVLSSTEDLYASELFNVQAPIK